RRGIVSNRRGSTSDTGDRLVGGSQDSPGGKRKRSKIQVTSHGGPFGWLGQVVVRYPWRVIALWIVAAVAVVATAPALPTTSTEGSCRPRDYESIRAASLQDKAFPQAGQVTAAAAIIVFSRPDHGRLTAADSAKVVSIANALSDKHIHNIVGVV